MEGRYSDEGKGQETFMKWIVEANPTFDVSLYKDLMDAIKGERDSFLMQQRLLVDKQREHHNLLTLFPSKLIVGSRPEIAIVTIETTIGKEAYKTGVDDNVLFEKKK